MIEPFARHCVQCDRPVTVALRSHPTAANALRSHPDALRLVRCDRSPGTAANALRPHPDALQPPAVTTPAADPSRDDVTRPPAAGGARLAHLASRVELRHAHASRRGRKRLSRDSDIRTGAPSASAPRRSGRRTQKARPSSRAVEDLAVARAVGGRDLAVEDRARTAPAVWTTRVCQSDSSLARTNETSRFDT
jgi:hypothetical protein